MVRYSLHHAHEYFAHRILTHRVTISTKAVAKVMFDAIGLPTRLSHSGNGRNLCSKPQTYSTCFIHSFFHPSIDHCQHPNSLVRCCHRITSLSSATDDPSLRGYRWIVTFLVECSKWLRMPNPMKSCWDWIQLNFTSGFCSQRHQQNSILFSDEQSVNE